MPNTLLQYRTATPGAKPDLGLMALGRLALNTASGKLFFKRNNGAESLVEVEDTRSIRARAQTAMVMGWMGG